MKEYYDVLVRQDGQNPWFRSYIKCEEADAINNLGGLAYIDGVVLTEFEQRPVPETLKTGESTIVDVFVAMRPSVDYCLN